MISLKEFNVGEIVFHNELTKVEHDTILISKINGKYEQLQLESHTLNRNSYREYLYFDSYMNHSCDSNVDHQYTDDLNYYCVCKKEIKLGDEITCDYALLKDYDHIYFECNCNFPNCRKIINCQYKS